MNQNRLTALVIEAGRSIMLEPQEVLQKAQSCDIAIYAVEKVEDL
jgi:DUF1009 family protein